FTHDKHMYSLFFTLYPRGIYLFIIMIPLAHNIRNSAGTHTAETGVVIRKTDIVVSCTYSLVQICLNPVLTDVVRARKIVIAVDMEISLKVLELYKAGKGMFFSTLYLPPVFTQLWRHII